MLSEAVRTASGRVHCYSCFGVTCLVAQSSDLSQRAASSRGQPAWSLEDLLLGTGIKALFPQVIRLLVFMLIVSRSLLNEAKIVFESVFIFKVRFEKKTLHCDVSERGLWGGGEPRGRFSCSVRHSQPPATHQMGLVTSLEPLGQSQIYMLLLTCSLTVWPRSGPCGYAWVAP